MIGDVSLIASSSFFMYTGASLMLTNTSRVEVKGGLTMSNSMLNLDDSSNFSTTIPDGYLNDISASKINIFKTASFVTANSMSISSSTIVIEDNATMTCQQGINVISYSVFNMSKNTKMNVLNNFNINEETQFNMKDNSNITIQTFNNIGGSDAVLRLYDNSSFLVTDMISISLVSIYLSGDSVFSCADTVSMTQITLEFTDNSILSMKSLGIHYGSNVSLNGNSKLICEEKLVIDKADYQTIPIVQLSSNTQRFVIESSSFSIYANFSVDEKSSIKTGGFNADNTWLTPCIFTISSNRNIHHLPLLFINGQITNFNRVTLKNTTSFDFFASETNITISLPTGFTLLAEKRLLRYGKSTNIFCHINNTVLTPKSFLESYCPRDNSFITPLDTLEGISFILSSLKTSLKSAYDTNEENVIYIGDYAFSMVLVEHFAFSIVSDKLVTITTNALKSSIFVNSNNGFIYNQVKCYYGAFVGNKFTCLSYMNCEGGYNENHVCVPCKREGCQRCFRYDGECIECNSTYYLNEGYCKPQTNCALVRNRFCGICKTGYVITGNGCEPIGIDGCAVRHNTGGCMLCDYSKNLMNINKTCEATKDQVLTHSEYYITSCKSGFYTNGDECISCTSQEPKSEFCENKKTTKCDTKSEFYSSTICETKSCENVTNSVHDSNGRCSNKENCALTNNDKCVECENGLILYDQEICKSTLEGGCATGNVSGCNRCELDYYYSYLTRSCHKCESPCETCYGNSSFCLSCETGYFINDNACTSDHELRAKCQLIVLTGCIECIHGYYRNGLDCKKCDAQCETCVVSGSCVTCHENYYRTLEGECLLQSSIIGCAVDVTTNGCNKCIKGYYTYKQNQCAKCRDECPQCADEKMCLSCIEEYVLVDHNCVMYTSIRECTESKDSKCVKCSFWNAPDSSGTYCDKSPVWWVIVIVVIVALVILIVVFTVFALVAFLLSHLTKKKKTEEKVTVFNMKKANISFTTLRGGVVVNMTEINFNEDTEEIPVNTETRQIFCVGNSEERTMKVQFSTKMNEQKYSLKVTPPVVVLKKGYACEFELFITPNFTTTIDSTIAIVSKSYTTGAETINNISIKAFTMLSTRLDPSELLECKKIGEGSFGIVYRGKYRNSDVAIKKMKLSADIDENGIFEFENEVNMLDKFRCDYIVHFFGAVFVSSEMCMVTEFAEYGSLQDLIHKKHVQDINMKLRIKFVLDASKGLLYLHENGILHRDIKPDNVLIVSMDYNHKCNGKLTDFGSSRNVNMLMTNMTFTKGIGTPSYMAPEVMNQEKYKKNADIYSFAMTMYECFSWSVAYPPEVFKFPWKIAEFVSAGKSLEKRGDMTSKEYELVSETWCHNPLQRLEINEVVLKLEEMFVNE
ncbi:protein serine/threonine kinase, putative [Entamoeba invadens IP1]|uniref:protein serine/threonine kinase, putative n=1 Tax=Entamoeba invadens IP1 TaxID=370355 RepID=UPI0002C3D0E4|nr:protein serine/threonine kinase, putative [Entamoeba invadens IP1]ELP93407.1 protein serine/threonine kinase, putative [Entamoeba invadens IP1]|eukprot:XP_004260178.1 protein serine/threonine kinase, putative [Entamoeba invadens IP1]